MILIDMWYGDDYRKADKIDITFYPNEGNYRGNIYVNGKIMGDYVCNDSVELEKSFPQLTFGRKETMKKRKLFDTWEDAEDVMYTNLLHRGNDPWEFEIDGESKEGILLFDDGKYFDDALVQIFVTDDDQVYEVYYTDLEDEDGDDIAYCDIDFDRPSDIMLHDDLVVIYEETQIVTK